MDPNIVFGVLPNGMKYALLRNSTPKDSVVLRMRFAVGSFAEAEDQRGLAHFLEHMAFNGSKGVPEGEMIKLLERKGLAFGADTNASTGFDETVYKLDLPNASDDLIDTGLMLMRETGGELTIDPARRAASTFSSSVRLMSSRSTTASRIQSASPSRLNPSSNPAVVMSFQVSDVKNGSGFSPRARFRPSAAASGVTSSSKDGTPALAKWAAIWAPMTPAPRTATERITDPVYRS